MGKHLLHVPSPSHKITCGAVPWAVFLIIVDVKIIEKLAGVKSLKKERKL